MLAQGQAQRKKSNLVENPKLPQCPSPKVPVQTLVTCALKLRVYSGHCIGPLVLN